MPSPTNKRNTSKRGYTKKEREALEIVKGMLKEQGIKTRSRGPAYRARLEAEKAERAKRGKRICQGTNQYGNPCGATPLKKGTVIEGVSVDGNWCLRHDPFVPEGAFIRFVQEPGVETIKNRPRTMGPMQQMAIAMQMAPGLVFGPHLKTLGLEWDANTGMLRYATKKDGTRKGGAKIVGFSREGVARVSKHDDLEAQRRAADSLFDRMFGKPRQSMELAGTGSSMAVVSIPQTEARAQAVVKVLAESGAVNISLGAEPELDATSE